MTYEETVTLGYARKTRKKNIGNGHQRRHHKISMKKTENRKLKAMVEDTTKGQGIEMIASNLSLITQYVVAGPTVKPELDNLFTLQIEKPPSDLQFLIIQLMFYHSISSKSHAKKMRLILKSLVKNIDYRLTCRHYLFLIENLKK